MMVKKKFQTYPEMKDSNVEWIGKIPKHWGIVPLFSVADETYEKNTGNIVNNVLSLSYGNIVRRNIDTNFGLLPESFETYQIVRQNGIVLRLIDLQNDKNSLRVGLVKELGIVTSAYTYIETKLDVFHKYIFYVLNNYDLQKVFYGLGGGVRQSLKYSELKRLPILLPSIVEQQAIANFLDRKTDLIDDLIAKKERMIELLKEKRQATITRAVTKGLDPYVVMDDSGVEWIGKKPEKWGVCKIRRCIVEHRQGYYSSDSYIDDGVKMLRITDLTELGGFKLDSCPQVAINDDIAPFMLEKGDFVFARTGGAGLFGFINKIEEQVIYASYLIRFRFDNKFNKEFIKYYFLSDFFQLALKQNIHGGVNQNIHAEDIKDKYVAIPPLDEQSIIVNYLDSQTKAISTIITRLNIQVDKLKEYRQSLIYGAITGKVNISEYKA